MPSVPSPDRRPVPIRQEQRPTQPVPPTRPIGRRADQLGGNRPKLSIVRSGEQPPAVNKVASPVFKSGASVRFGGRNWELVEDDGVISQIVGKNARGGTVERYVITADLLASGNIPVPMQDRPNNVGVRPAQGQQSEQRVPFANRFPAGVGASFDGQRWVSTGMKDATTGKLIFTPEGGGEPIAIGADILQAKGAFPLPPEPGSPAVEAAGKAYHVRPGQDVYVLRSSGKIEKGWEVKHIGITGKVTMESVDGQGRLISRGDPREFIDDLNRPTVPEDIGKIDFNNVRTKMALERREMIIHVVRRLAAGGLVGSKGFYRSDRLITELQTVFDHPSQDGINLLPNTGGLRDKVRELLNRELDEQRRRGNS